MKRYPTVNPTADIHLTDAEETALRAVNEPGMTPTIDEALLQGLIEKDLVERNDDAVFTTRLGRDWVWYHDND